MNGLRTPGIRTEETTEGNLIADALLDAAEDLAPAFGVPTPNIALQNGGGIRNNNVVPAGDISELTLFSMVPFANFVSVVPDVPATQLKEILENAVSRVEFVDGRFAQVSGFSLVWDATGTPQVLDSAGNVLTPGTRVVEVMLDDGTPIVAGGQVVAGAPSVNVATIVFLARAATSTRSGGAVHDARRDLLPGAPGLRDRGPDRLDHGGGLPGGGRRADHPPELRSTLVGGRRPIRSAGAIRSRHRSRTPGATSDRAA